MAAVEVQKEEETVPDPTAGRDKIKKNASQAATELLEGLRCLDMMSEYRQCICEWATHYVHVWRSYCFVICCSC